MTTMANMMLTVAELVSNVHRGTQGSASTFSIADTTLSEAAGHWTGGTIFLLTGDSAGLVIDGITHTEHLLSFTTIYPPDTVAKDVAYAVADATFPKDRLIEAINRAYTSAEVLTKDTSQTINDDDVIELDAGIGNVRRVVVDGEDSHYWSEMSGYIIFADGKEPGSSDEIEVWYPAHLSELDTDGVIVDEVDQAWLKWAAVVNLWRWHIQKVDKDDPIALDMLNEAKQMEAQYQPLRVGMPAKINYGAW